ncbi:MAG: excinuclease ABC subunit UvrA [Treponemataceae bacterium]
MEQSRIQEISCGPKLVIKGAREHNLKNVDLEIPRNKLVVFSGLSGSGKSSLAFDTIFAEGQRRYMESLSSYARQFLGRMDKPDVDLIEGLSPAISIEQKSTNKNPRSTVGTITEIYDYYRLLFARVGKPHCYVCGREIQEQSIDQIIDVIMSWQDGTKIQILSPVIRGRKGEHQKILDDAKSAGFVRARIDGVMADLDENIKLDKQKKHTIEIVVDRIVKSDQIRTRLADSIEIALNNAGGIVLVSRKFTQANGEILDEEVFFSQKNACPDCGVSVPELQPRLFSFNNPFGACPECTGLGKKMEWDVDKILPDKNLTFNERALPFFNPESEWNHSMFEAIANEAGFTLDTQFSKLTEKQLDYLWNGNPEKKIHWIYKKQSGEGYSEYNRAWHGIMSEMKRRYSEAWGDTQKKNMEEKFMKISECSCCKGMRLRQEALSVFVGGKNIWQLTELSVIDSIEFFENLNLTENENKIAAQVLKEIRARLSFLKNVGLEYLTLERAAETLSGGEAQRIRLATQIGSALCGVMYILDEPSIGLHQKDNQKLIDTLLMLRDNGNTVIVVEHDEQTLRTADYLVDLGQGAGVEGGKIVAAGTPDFVAKIEDSVTGRYLAGTLNMPFPLKRRKGNGNFLQVWGAKEHNLKNIDISIPLGVFTCITGVSGSGKSTLMSDIIYPAVSNKLMKTNYPVGECASIDGVECLDKVISIDQSPIGRSPRSNPATYVGVFDAVRDLYASLPESRARGYKKGRFSFNVKGGRCENCQGAGENIIEMNFLPDVYIRCEVCNGQRFNKETLEVLYKGKSINDVLNMTVDEACDFFSAVPLIYRKISTLKSVGLGYIRLGQNALTLSGGEAQRVKLANELSRPGTGKTLYILDEPTTGLHFADVKQLMSVIQKLVDNGNSVLMIEHNIDVIMQADYVIDLGPDGGTGGGSVITFGTPEQVAECENSYTGYFLKEFLKKQNAKDKTNQQ